MDSESTAQHDALAAASAYATAPPPKRKRGRPRKVRPMTRFEDVGPPPVDDPLAANEWAHKICAIALYQSVHDPNADERSRRTEIATLAGRMSALTPLSRIKRAEAAVLGGAEYHDGPSMELTPDAPEAAAVDSGTGGPAARRGRPRKRALR